MPGYLPNLLILLAIFASGVVFLVKRIYWHPLSKFPGPILPAITSFYQFHKLWKGQEGPWYRGLHQKYGTHHVLSYWFAVRLLGLTRADFSPAKVLS